MLGGILRPVINERVALLDTLIAQWPVLEGIGLDDPQSPLA